MAGFRESLGNAYRSAVCNSVDFRSQVAGLTLRQAPAALALVNVINGVQGLYCDRDEGATEDEVAPRPFEGGQCPGVNYNGVIQRQAINNSTCEIIPNNLSFTNQPGPLSQPRTTNPNGTITVRTLNGLGGQINASTFNPDPTINECEFSGTQVTGLEVTRSDGLPDDCGGPPRELPEPSDGWELPPINFTYENDLGITVNATANISLNPAVSIDGSLSFPTTVTVGDINLNGQLNIDGSLTLSPTININPPGEPPTVGPSLPGDEPAEPDETGSVLIGVAIAVQATGPAVTVINTVGAPLLLVPRAASVNFLYSTDDGDFWSSDFDAKNGDCFVPVPPGLVAIDAAVTPYPGVNLNWNRVYAEQRIPADA